MNLFRVDFKQGKTDAVDYGTVVHSLTDTADARAIISLALSEERLNSVVSSWIREPRRLTFECFVDDWISDYILSGTYEHERSISHYEVKLYRDNVLIFTGIIDTSALSYDPAAETIKFTCYDKLKLISLFADTTFFYFNVAGYTPYQILAYLTQQIEYLIPIDIPKSGSQFTLPSWAIPEPAVNPLPASAAVFMDIDYSATIIPPVAGGYAISPYTGSFGAPYSGWCYASTITNTITYVFALKKIWIGHAGDNISDIYYARFKAVIIRVYSETCTQITTYDATADWSTTLTDVTEGSEATGFEDFFIPYLSSYNDITQLLPILALNDKIYRETAGIEIGHRFPFFYGTLLPAKIHPGKEYTAATMVSLNTNMLQVLQAVLLMYDCTLWASSGGTIYLKSLAYDPAATPIPVADADLLALSVSRATPELPDTSLLDVLAGDTTLLQRLIKPFLTLRLAGWKVSLTIDCLENYTLALHSIITVKEQNYVITSLLTNYELDQYEITAWTV